MVPKSAREVAFGGLFVHGDGLAGAFAGPSEEALLEPQAAIENAEHGGEGAGRDLTQVVHNVPFLNIIQTTVWGVGLGMRGIRAAVNPRKETMRLICPDTGAQVNCVRHLLYAC